MSSSRPGRVIWHIDRPAHLPAAELFTISGWVAADTPVGDIHPCSGQFESFQWIVRADLQPAPEGRSWAWGFEARATGKILAGKTLMCSFQAMTETGTLSWHFTETIDSDRKQRKIKAIASLLLPGIAPRRTSCFLDFLPADKPSEEPLLTSGFNYPPAVDELIARHADGWILDCGAGNRPIYYDNVVNLEVAPYPSTDVRADAERLPFRDNCFDGVVTLAVLEHVRRPWIVAKELIRVLKPGGTIIADVPFLQPVHAYPDHFFNMTSDGLQSLFNESCAIVSTAVPHYGRPIYTLSWFLQRYAAGLPEDVCAKFLKLSVSDLMAPAETLAAADYVAALSKPFAFELASVTSIVARKR